MKPSFAYCGIVLLLVSCQKKDWTCTCVVTKSAADGTYTRAISHKSRYRAEKDCIHYGDAIVAGAGSYDCNVE